MRYQKKAALARAERNCKTYLKVKTNIKIFLEMLARLWYLIYKNNELSKSTPFDS
jgi:hypothetical protein